MGMWSMRADGLQSEARNSQPRTADCDVIAQLIWRFVTTSVKPGKPHVLRQFVTSLLRTFQLYRTIGVGLNTLLFKENEVYNLYSKKYL